MSLSSKLLTSADLRARAKARAGKKFQKQQQQQGKAQKRYDKQLQTFEHEQERGHADFKVRRAIELPELKEDMQGGYGGGYQGGHYDNRGARNMNNHNYPSQRHGDGRFQGGYG